MDDDVIEMTPAMIAAGVDAFYEFDIELTPTETIVKYIFAQMFSKVTEIPPQKSEVTLA